MNRISRHFASLLFPRGVLPEPIRIRGDSIHHDRLAVQHRKGPAHSAEIVPEQLGHREVQISKCAGLIQTAAPQLPHNPILIELSDDEIIHIATDTEEPASHQILQRRNRLPHILEVQIPTSRLDPHSRRIGSRKRTWGRRHAEKPLEFFVAHRVPSYSEPWKNVCTFFTDFAARAVSSFSSSSLVIAISNSKASGL